jgi:hypothetical protein
VTRSYRLTMSLAVRKVRDLSLGSLVIMRRKSTPTVRSSSAEGCSRLVEPVPTLKYSFPCSNTKVFVRSYNTWLRRSLRHRSRLVPISFFRLRNLSSSFRRFSGASMTSLRGRRHSSSSGPGRTFSPRRVAAGF